jgi:hypothetical protein
MGGYQEDPLNDRSAFGFFPLTIAAAIPATQPGDVIKTAIQIVMSGTTADPDGNVQIGSDDAHCWVSIIPSGQAAPAETIEHNGTLVGKEPILDFEDTATVTWTITDDPATKTITISADAAGGSGGGSHNGEIGTIVFNDGDIDPTTATYLTVNTGASTIPAWITITTSSLPNDTIHIATGYAALVNAVCSFDAGTGGDPVDFVLDSSAGHLDQVNGTVPLSCGLSASINSSVNNLQLRADNNGFDYNHVAGCKIRLTCIASP